MKRTTAHTIYNDSITQGWGTRGPHKHLLWPA